MNASMRRVSVAYLLSPLSCLIFADPSLAQGRLEREAFTWAGHIAEDRWINVRTLRGNIEVTRGSGDKVEVIATRRTRRGDPDFVRFDVKKYGAGDGNVLICALWGENSDCTEDSYRSRAGDRRFRENDVVVDFAVHVPKGVRISVHTVNGDVRVEDAAAEVDAEGVNGNVTVSTANGPVNARTVNGWVHATMGKFDPGSDMRFSTTNGSVVAEFTGDIDADVELVAVNGRFTTDFPVTIAGRIDPRRLRATIGKGGAHIRLATFNGNVELRKR
ncbi:MAG TPA: hypothetical protein VF483_03500 [Gemmatimonadaceae bacterium]